MQHLQKQESTIAHQSEAEMSKNKTNKTKDYSEGMDLSFGDGSPSG